MPATIIYLAGGASVEVEGDAATVKAALAKDLDPIAAFQNSSGGQAYILRSQVEGWEDVAVSAEQAEPRKPRGTGRDKSAAARNR